jgi:hypothetical protein
MKSREQSGRRLLIAVVLGLAAWGLLLALGAYLGLWHQTPRQAGIRDPRKFWIVLGVVTAFLTLWGGALGVRALRIHRRKRQEHPRPRQDPAER